MKDFGSSQEVVTLGLSLFVFGLAVGPMVLSPLSEVSATISSPHNIPLIALRFMVGSQYMSYLSFSF
jgi:hypothetical protein